LLLLQAYLEETKCASALPKVIVTGYKELNLIYYFTAGETEVRRELLTVQLSFTHCSLNFTLPSPV
jgi:ribosome-binding ATPase YchF (GTP1/OBG family)